MAISVPSTSPSTDEVHLQLLRSAGTAKRFEISERLTTSVLTLSKNAIRRLDPTLSETEVGLRFVELNYGAELAQRVRRHLEGR